MARTNQTFKKRQRENKLREKAQLKHERRQQRRMERKESQALGAENTSAQPGSDQVEARALSELGVEQSS